MSFLDEFIGGTLVKIGGVLKPKRKHINLIGATGTDNAATDSTDVTLPAATSAPPVATLAELRALSTLDGTVTTGQTRHVAGDPIPWVYDPSTGANFTDDGATCLLPNDTNVLSNGRWYRATSSPILPTIAALRLAVSGSHKTIHVQAYATLGDGGGGIFDYDASDTTSADNGGTIIVAGTRRYKRRYDKHHINAAWFGAVPDAVAGAHTFTGTDNRAAINAAIASLPAAGGELVFGVGNYGVRQNGSPAATMSGVQASGTTPPVMTITGTPNAGNIRLVVQVTTGGARGTMIFKWSKDDGATFTTGFVSAATNALAGTGLTLNWATGTNYSTDNLYTAFSYATPILSALPNCTRVRGVKNGTSTSGGATQIITDSDYPVIGLVEKQSIELGDFTIAGLLASPTTPGVAFVDTHDSELRHMTIKGFDVGLLMAYDVGRGTGISSFNNKLDHCRIISNVTYNIDCEANSNNTSIIHSEFGGGGLTGLRFIDSSGLTIVGGDAEGCASLGLDVDATQAGVNAVGDAYSQVVINGFHLEGAGPSIAAARFGHTKPCRGNVMIGCTIFSTGGTSGIDAVRVENNSEVIQIGSKEQSGWSTTTMTSAVDITGRHGDCQTLRNDENVANGEGVTQRFASRNDASAWTDAYVTIAKFITVAAGAETSAAGWYVLNAGASAYAGGPTVANAQAGIEATVLYLGSGGNRARSGGIRARNNVSIVAARNAANNADINVLYTDASDDVILQGKTGNSYLSINGDDTVGFAASGGFTYSGGSQTWKTNLGVTKFTFNMTTGSIAAAGGLGVNGAPAPAQALRAGQITDSTGSAATGAAVDVTTGGLADPAKCNDNFHRILTVLNKIEAMLSAAAGGTGISA